MSLSMFCGIGPAALSVPAALQNRSRIFEIYTFLVTLSHVPLLLYQMIVSCCLFRGQEVKVRILRFPKTLLCNTLLA